MKKTIFLLSFVFLAVLVTTYYSCETDPEEVCLQDEICEGQFVTACCTEDDECVYKYNGKEYTEDQLDQLAEELGCASAVGVLKSGSQEDELSAVKEQLKALMSRVRESCKACK